MPRSGTFERKRRCLRLGAFSGGAAARDGAGARCRCRRPRRPRGGCWRSTSGSRSPPRSRSLSGASRCARARRACPRLISPQGVASLRRLIFLKRHVSHASNLSRAISNEGGRLRRSRRCRLGRWWWPSAFSLTPPTAPSLPSRSAPCPGSQRCKATRASCQLNRHGARPVRARTAPASEPARRRARARGRPAVARGRARGGRGAALGAILALSLRGTGRGCAARAGGGPHLGAPPGTPPPRPRRRAAAW